MPGSRTHWEPPTAIKPSFLFTNGQQVGSLQSTGSSVKASFDVNYTPVSAHYPSAVPAEVVVQQGDTLKLMAARVLGDANLWYLIAQENGLSDPNAVLITGTSLRIPNNVVSLSNSASSFKPFNVSEAIGDTTPTQPAPPVPASGKQGCGVLGQIIMIVVAIVVTYYSFGAGGGGWAGSLGSTIGGGGAGGAAVGMGIAAAAGSVASQGVGMAIGAQDKFSWRTVATAGLTAGLTQGLGLNSLTPIGDNASAWYNVAAQGMATNLVGQGVNIALGLQDKFSWREVAISAVAAPIARKTGEWASDTLPTNGSTFGRTLGVSVTQGVSSAAVRSALGGRMDFVSVLADAFGNAIGNSIVDKATPQATAGLGKASNSGSWNDDELQEVQVTAKKIDNNPDAIFDVGDMVLPDEWRNIEAKAPSLTVGVTAQRGDSISKLVGSSDPKAIKAFMHANGMKGDNSTIYAGRDYVLPGADDYAAATGRQGLAVLNRDNARLAPEVTLEESASVAASSSSGSRFLDNQASLNQSAAERLLFGGGITNGAEVRPYTPVFKDNFAGHVLSGLDDMAGLLASPFRDGPTRGLFSNENLYGNRLMDAKMGLVLSAGGELTSLARGFNGGALSVGSFPEISATTRIRGETIAANVRPVEVLAGDPNRIAIIGRSMDAVDPYADTLRAMGADVNVFSSAADVPTAARQEFTQLKKLYDGRIPNAVIVESKMYNANVGWAEKVRSEGYTIVNLGNPFNNPTSSVFFNAEQLTMFGRVSQ